MSSIILLALLRTLAILGALLILFFLQTLIYPTDKLFLAVAGGSGDPGAEFVSPEPYVTADLFWELPAEGPNVSEASPAGLKNETGLGNISWPLTEQFELMTLLKEALPVIEIELLDKEAPQEIQQAVPVPEENSEALQPTGMIKRFDSAEDTETDPNTLEGMANTGRADKKITQSIFLRGILMAVDYFMILLLAVSVVPAWAKDIKE
ncbi:hypothetical protein DUI87_32605 [Hirundo rustica rustica]|uniref:Uncharacterized protein n=1 Tax=Hirundo rustica rustica TaxID=333673 RepID=A0A3M0IPZ7_HIRRU|nr:hypothetical protein DUI87_32605 [Hirundo rustica rustica]